jgi:anti-sigma-K factor RskA
MNDDELPAELAMIEQAMSSGPRPGSSLRKRVTDRVEMELHRSRRLAFWQYASAIAAAVLLALNFSISVAHMPRQNPDMDRNAVAALRDQMGRMQLALSDDEIERQCLLLAAGERLVPSATPYGSAGATTASVQPNR